jgi:alpha-N-acetylglucosaminidase
MKQKRLNVRIYKVKNEASLLKILVLLLFIIMVQGPLFARPRATEPLGLSEARGVINRFTGGQMNVHLSLGLPCTADGADRYVYHVSHGQLYVDASSGVALCRGFYDYVKSLGAGICSWSGNRFALPPHLSDVKAKTVTSPYRDHAYMNVVTYGYSMPYWDTTRWDKEIDWMALHGVDMPLMLIAQEAVYRMVFHKMGLSDAEIDSWEVGPAHLPWMRMGNISRSETVPFEGPLSKNWHQEQIALLRHILARIRPLGMKPVFPAFGGFVPKAFTEHYPDAKLTETGWGGSFHNYRLDPLSPHFVKIGQLFVQTWDSIFGAGKYYLSDSFNEMAVPSDTALLTSYGDAVYASIHSANPDATWVMQGWTLGYQRDEWGSGRLQALLRHVPADRMMLLDMATDYNKCFWQNGYNWDAYPAFYGKQWVWSVIPNMGGKTAQTGQLSYYANGRFDALNAPNRGNLTGYGFAPEGIENNELLYELVADGGWHADSLQLKDWLSNYARCRYGSYPADVASYYDGLLHSVYNSFTDHPRFAWQRRPDHDVRGTVAENDAFYQGVVHLFAHPSQMWNSPLYRSDLIEAAAFYAGGRAEQLMPSIQQAIDQGDTLTADKLIARFRTLLTDADRILTLHPLYRLERWEQMAARMGTDATESKTYARNARRIVSTWGTSASSGLNDYSARVWSGLVRGYYLPRWLAYYSNALGRTHIDIRAWEDAWVDSAPSLQSAESVPADTLGFLQHIIAEGRLQSSAAH